MHNELQYLPLTFPSLPFGKNETPIDLKRLLYKGGASTRVNRVNQAIQEGLLGSIQSERLNLVQLLHELIAGNIAGGGSHETARSQVDLIVAFFGWADKVGAALTLSEVLATYLAWSEHLLHRVRVAKDMKSSTAYSYAAYVGLLLDGALARATPMIRLTRLRQSKGRKTPQGAEADKQMLRSTFAFGHLLQEVCDGLTLGAIWGPRPARIPRQGGGEIVISSVNRSTVPEHERESWNIKRTIAKDLAYASDRSLHSRASLINLRIQAELLMFIGQTGKNLTQAQRLKFRHFSYSSDIDGYKVREYKNRRGGEVLFVIYSEYRNHFERYLEWRRALFPGSDQLFPFILRGALESARPKFTAIIDVCKGEGVQWSPPSALRGAKVNWLLRRSGDPGLTADMAQHSKEMTLEVYAVPSMQRAVGEVTRFWLRNDPTLAQPDPMLSVAPGTCDGNPKPSPAKPESAPVPDCKRPSGCLWCEHHRDIDALDYVWSVACFRHLKVIELSNHCPPQLERDSPHPADHTIRRLSQKLAWFRDSNAIRRGWVEEALARVEEGDYHTHWAYLIQPMEGISG